MAEGDASPQYSPQDWARSYAAERPWMLPVYGCQQLAMRFGNLGKLWDSWHADTRANVLHGCGLGKEYNDRRWQDLSGGQQVRVEAHLRGMLAELRGIGIDYLDGETE